MSMYKITLNECVYDDKGDIIVRFGKTTHQQITVYAKSATHAIKKIKRDLEITDDMINALRISSAEEILQDYEQDLDAWSDPWLEVEAGIELDDITNKTRQQEKLKQKICPLMSTRTKGNYNMHQPCIKDKCMFWRQVYSTEHILQTPDCVIALSILMVDGLMRV